MAGIGVEGGLPPVVQRKCAMEKNLLGTNPLEANRSTSTSTSTAASASTASTLNLSRRSFIGAAGLAGVAALFALAGCGSSADSGSDSAADSTAGTAATDSAESSDASATASTGDESVIRFGCEASYAPYEWKQDKETEYTLPIENMDGAYADGYDIQLMKMIGEALGRTPVIVNISFSGLISALQAGQIDAICAGMSATEERKSSVDFSNPYLKSGVAIMVARDSKYADATSLEDFKGASVLGQKSSLPDSVIDQIPEVNHLDPVDFIPDSIARLLNGTVDAVVVDQNNKNLYEETYPDFKVIVFEDGKGFDTPGVDPCVAVLKDDPQGILDTINQVIADNLGTTEQQQELWDACTERAPE